MRRHKVSADQANQRFDVVAAEWLDLGRSQVTKLIKSGRLQVDNQTVKPGTKLSQGQRLLFQPGEVEPRALKVPIVYQDKAIMVVEKPAGLAVHPASRYRLGPTLVDFARQITDDPDLDRPGIVHRLDKETSGLIILAKTAKSKAELQRTFKSRQVDKEYLVLVQGRLSSQRGSIKLPIAAGIGMRRVVETSGRSAETAFEVIKKYANQTLVRVWPRTGRTHQIRVHFAAIGHPVIGDRLYGRADPRLGRQFLHAHKLKFRSPTGQWVEVESPLPNDLKHYLESL